MTGEELCLDLSDDFVDEALHGSVDFIGDADRVNVRADGRDRVALELCGVLQDGV